MNNPARAKVARSFIERILSKYHKMQDEVLTDKTPPPPFQGRGIIICAGGPRYFTCAWVLLQLLRKVHRSALPIQVWYRGPEELDARMIGLLQTIENVELVDATKVPGYSRIRFLRGWELKPFAIMNCTFREVILIDADNVPVRDPEFLFETAQYQEFGAIFWPDLEPIPTSSPIWKMTRVPYRDEPSFESGQIVVDKLRCWKPMLLTMHLNEHADFYCGKVLHGDKDTFHFAWHMADCEYGMPSQGPYRYYAPPDPRWVGCGPVLLQVDFDGNLVFQHRNWPKWIAYGDNLLFPGFLYQGECLEFLQQLGALWDGRMFDSRPQLQEARPKQAEVERWYRYVTLGDNHRLLEFLPDHSFGRGATENERRWLLHDEGGNPAIEIEGKQGLTCRLTQGPDNIWRGRWTFNEGFLVELIPTSPPCIHLETKC